MPITLQSSCSVRLNNVSVMVLSSDGNQRDTLTSLLTAKYDPAHSKKVLYLVHKRIVTLLNLITESYICPVDRITINCCCHYHYQVHEQRFTLTIGCTSATSIKYKCSCKIRCSIVLWGSCCRNTSINVQFIRIRKS